MKAIGSCVLFRPTSAFVALKSDTSGHDRQGLAGTLRGLSVSSDESTIEGPFLRQICPQQREGRPRQNDALFNSKHEMILFVLLMMIHFPKVAQKWEK
jgi:hypothetical protein